MPKKKNDDIKEEIKKVVKKKKRKVYFGQEVQDAIVEYNASKKASKRNQIYGTRIHAAFDKLAENIINTFKFTYFDDPFQDVKHEVIDPYDPKATIRDFMENQDLMLMNVLCISTIEHIGTTDYATNERQNIVDKNAAINALKQILDDGENCLISIPIGYNHFLDSWLEENLDILNCFAYKKVLWILNNNLGHTVNPNGNGELHIRTDTPDGVKSLWNYYADVKSIKGEKYREPFPAGNYVLFIEGWK